MQKRKLSQLSRIAQLKREMELAELARLAGRKQDMHVQREELSDAAREARVIAQASTPEAKTAELFTGWVSLRHAEIDDLIARLNEEMAVQKAKAALAVGRRDVLQQIESRVREAERLKRGRS
jgi:hypothetical protein